MAALVKDYMIAKKEIVTPDDSVASAIDLMIENDIGSVIVEDENRNIVGIFTERDLLRRYRQNQSKFLRLTISEVMTQPVITIEEGAKLSDAITLMEENKIGVFRWWTGTSISLGYSSGGNFSIDYLWRNYRPLKAWSNLSGDELVPLHFRGILFRNENHQLYYGSYPHRALFG